MIKFKQKVKKIPGGFVKEAKKEVNEPGYHEKAIKFVAKQSL